MNTERKTMDKDPDSLSRNDRGMSPLERVLETRLQHGGSRKAEGCGDNSITQSFECRPQGEGDSGDLWQPDYEQILYKHHPGAGKFYDGETYEDVSFAEDVPQQESHRRASPVVDSEVKATDFSVPRSVTLDVKDVKQAKRSPPLEDDEGLHSIYNQLSLLDRHLFVWIILVMAIALLVGYNHPGVKEHLEVVNISSVSLPIAVGLWVMLYPGFCKVRYELLSQMLKGGQLRSNILLSFILNWLVGPALMTGLAWATLPDLPTYRTGVILIGIARCIAMVLVWNDLAKGDAELCAVLVAFNSILQILLFSPFTLLYLRVVSRGDGVDVSVRTVTESVLLFLGIPFAAGIVTRLLLRSAKDTKWYDTMFVPFIAPWALLGLLYTIFIMFSVQAHDIMDNIVSLCRVVVPMLMHFVIMFFTATATCQWMKLPYEQLVTQSFTAASNNFELAIAVAVGTFGIDSHEALAATIGPLIEFPVLLGLVYVTLYFRRKSIF